MHCKQVSMLIVAQVVSICLCDMDLQPSIDWNIDYLHNTQSDAFGDADISSGVLPFDPPVPFVTKAKLLTRKSFNGPSEASIYISSEKDGKGSRSSNHAESRSVDLPACSIIYSEKYEQICPSENGGWDAAVEQTPFVLTWTEDATFGDDEIEYFASSLDIKSWEQFAYLQDLKTNGGNGNGNNGDSSSNSGNGYQTQTPSTTGGNDHYGSGQTTSSSSDAGNNNNSQGGSQVQTSSTFDCGVNDHYGNALTSQEGDGNGGNQNCGQTQSSSTNSGYQTEFYGDGASTASPTDPGNGNNNQGGYPTQSPSSNSNNNQGSSETVSPSTSNNGNSNPGGNQTPLPTNPGNGNYQSRGHTTGASLYDTNAVASTNDNYVNVAATATAHYVKPTDCYC